MKIQCSCGAKYSFDVTPENAANPVRFICPNCGLDSSALVNELIQREQAAPAPNPPALEVLVPAAEKAPRLRISLAQPHAPATPASDPSGAPATVFCAKHPREPATEKCAVCHKPICPKCLALFGYFCSPFCKAKADAENIRVPAYANLSTAVEARLLRRMARVFAAIAVLVVLILAAGGWYIFYGRLPHAVYSVPFEQRASFGQCRPVGADQLVYLHGGTLARCDLKTKKTVWSHELISQAQVDAVTTRLSQMENGQSFHHSGEQLQKIAWQALEAELTLRVSGSNVWLGDAGRLTHYDWDTGVESQSLPLGPDGTLAAGAGELLVMRESAAGAKFATHINYADGAERTEEFRGTGKLTLITATEAPAGGGLPSANGTPGRALDPSKVAEQAQNLSTPARLALPALLANNIHQQQIMAEVNDDTPQKTKPPEPAVAPVETFALVPGPAGLVQYSVKMIEKNFVSRSAMKAPGKSVINGNLNAGMGTEAVNETLNEMQRANGGDLVTEDQSRYQVTLRRPDVADAPDWTGEVIGYPAVYALKTVTVIAAGKSVLVFDAANKKIWDATLTYPVAPDRRGANGEASPLGEGPCVERDGTLYVVDQAVLSAFDLATGNARWRLPSVGIVGLFFDGPGAIYVNTTTANPDKIKYSRQIDVAESIDALLLKVEAKTGRNLWTARTGGFASYVSGPYLYTLQAHDVVVDDMTSDLTSGLQKPAFLKLFRLDPANGHTLWEYDEPRAPLAVAFNKNVISLVFHSEVEVLKALTL